VGADAGEQFGFDLVNGQTIHCGKCRVGWERLKVEVGREAKNLFWLP
jgi:hypothetical protein